MTNLTEITQLVSGLPIGVLGIVLILAAFGLAAFAIYAVLAVAKKEK